MYPDTEMSIAMAKSLAELRTPYLAEIARLQDLTEYDEPHEEAWPSFVVLKAELKLLHELVGAITTCLVEWRT